ncbi:hypothetical protein N5C67_03500 [Comamonas thiooxydans]|uniref:hypothetical protein n=1 Tax=Comamonas thiooxydans TaxID=363952 RepID=UPI00244C09D8|nr:hypothetical protein [Comamonas thiooxydans]MDH1251712.1 hypothetical protein [Comamonas thiooxydans]
MSNFLNFDDTYTKTALVFGITSTNFKTEDGKLIDQSKVSIYAELSGDAAVGGTATVLLWGTSSNAVSVKNAGKQFPAMVELTVRKGARSLGKEVEEIVGFNYLQAVRVMPVEASKKAA